MGKDLNEINSSVEKANGEQINVVSTGDDSKNSSECSNEKEKEEFVKMFNALSPDVTKADKTIDCYVKSLSWATKNKGVYNIALTGLYGSGKSTILKKFMETDVDHKYITVSMANLENDNESQNIHSNYESSKNS